MPRRDAPSIAPRAERAALGREADAPGRHVGTREGRAQRHVRAGVDDAHAVRADESHAARAARLQQLRQLRLREPGRDHDQGGDARPRAVARGGWHAFGGHRDDRELDRPGRVEHGPARAPAADEVDVRVDGVQLATEPRRQGVPERRAAERVRPPRGADHGDRARAHDVPDGGDRRHAVAILEAPPGVLPQLGRKLDLDPVGRRVHVDREAGLAEDADHASVLGQHRRHEGADPARGRDLRQVRDQHGGEAAALHLVRDREGDLRPPGALELEHRVRDDALLGT